jgi:putative ABC transport system permease protein
LIVSHDYQTKINEAERSFDLSANFTPFKIPLEMNSDKKYKEVISAVNDTAKQLKLNYVKRVRYAGYMQSNGKLNYSKPIRLVMFQTYTVHPTALMRNFNLTPQIIQKKSANLNNGINGYSAYIMPIQFSERHPQSREGNFFLETTNPNKFNTFRQQLSYNLSKIFKTKISSSDLLIRDPDGITSLTFESFDSPEKLKNVFNTALFFLFAFIIIWIISNARILSIYKLNGFSTIRMLKRTMGKTYLFSIIGLAILDMLSYYALHLNVDMNIITKQTIMMIMLLGATITLINVFQYFNFNNQINRKNYNRLNFVVLYLIKSASIMACLITLVPLTELTMSSYSYINHHNDYSKQNNFSIFYPYITGNNQYGVNLEDGKRLDHNMYEYLNTRGALIYDDSDLDQPVPDYMKFLKVNPNYLKQFPLYDTHGRTISLSNDSKDILLAIPFKKTSIQNKNKLIAYIKKISQLDIKRIPKIKIVYTSNQYHTFKSINTGSEMSDYAVFVTTSNNSSFVERNIMDGAGPRDGIKIPIGSSLHSTYNQMKNRLIQYNYDDNYPQLIKMSDYYHEDLLMSMGDVAAEVLTVSFGFLITLILIIYVTTLYFKNFKRNIFIRKMNGYSNLKAYAYFWMLMMAQYLAIILIMYLGGMFSIIMLTTTLIVLIIELLISVSVIRVINSTNWGEIINGQ